jgi:hypothetical protein
MVFPTVVGDVSPQLILVEGEPGRLDIHLEVVGTLRRPIDGKR